jgi:hypothetical protein
MKYLPSNLMFVDVLTKSLPGLKFTEFVKEMGLKVVYTSVFKYSLKPIQY